jgi:HAMP domain-containing protein
MKIKYKFSILFVLLIFSMLSITGYISFKATESAIVESSLKSMDSDLENILDKIRALHEKASSDLVLALQYPVFEEYFSLPETRAGNKYNDNGIIQFTPKQKELKGKIEQWSYFIQSRFPVEETCLIDRTGQEHVRLTFREIAPDEDFSSEEEGAHFFKPSFEIGKNEVHVAYPYMSPDALKWVFAYVSPIVLQDGSKPAIYHFEIPISFFQEQVKAASGRTFILDQNDFVIADSNNHIDIALKQGSDAEEVHNLDGYFPLTESISSSHDFKRIISEMKAGRQGSGYFTDGNVKYYVVYKPLPTFGWSIGTIKSYDQLLEGDYSLNKLKRVMASITILSILLSLALIFSVTETITKPLKELTNAATELSKGNINVALPVIKSKGEVYDLNESIKGTLAAIYLLTSEIEKLEINNVKKRK